MSRAGSIAEPTTPADTQIEEQNDPYPLILGTSYHTSQKEGQGSSGAQEGQVDLNPPGPMDLRELALSTERAFEVLEPWYQTKQSVPALASISRQAVQYIKAIDFSVVASQKGFNIANDALDLANTLKPVGTHSIDDERKAEVERQKFLKGMVDQAVRGHKKAQEAMGKFRDVRVVMHELIKKAKAAQQEKGSNKTLVELEKGISALEEFSNNISLYVSWWNEMEMTHLTQEGSTRALIVNYSSLRQMAVVKRWEGLKGGYLEYTNKIRALQDKHPLLFPESVRNGGGNPLKRFFRSIFS
ncbi:hypothetical protein B0H34DRAFT_841410 [Crassisporium funariophilum]|nr:hypothetical protein B0H34DRAFT_841410 [Crassisporium funariophilum]